MSQFLPLYETVLFESYEKKQSGIVIPNQELKTKLGKVISAGPGKVTQFGVVETKVKPGDVIVYRAYAAEPVYIDNKELFCVSESDILGVIKN